MAHTASGQEPTSLRPGFHPIYNLTGADPVLVDERPLLGALLFENSASDARDHCANERTFLSWLRLSMYLSIVSIAIIISFHFRSKPTGLERRMALPLGIIFWVVSLMCLANGFANYVRTVNKYSRKAALVQSGWKTHLTVTVVGVIIFGSCILFIATGAETRR
ncbi:DUF202 domain-containing protein [Aspergillus clavatus NRRL 1]|uniref:PF02656 domain protein n=1 Tax=Aspergillus clavatus (strain ATCC 1007 / CBS 513.65 / DSM 816 / NCTC 3887 / NRRL 1 / QM 1276 / 107) TaxID=344612 RepID=A1CTZ9_ASPCL|nr:PF02656 domain protein [Aspergillus clavatus NRRL 1]EAW06786.1 PF02656 domain protein [Aspergillus clavatus NRRL 1]